MKCPIDDSDLVMTDRQGIEIDYCPKCRGVWLDRGELDKIIDRAAGDMAPARPQPQQQPAPARHYGHDYDDRDHRHRYPKKKKSVLSEIFDF